MKEESLSRKKRTHRLGDIKIGIPIKVIKTATAEDVFKIVANFKHHLAENRHGWVRKKYKPV